jgi:uncharacterized membrane protein (DUF4010 family)
MAAPDTVPSLLFCELSLATVAELSSKRHQPSSVLALAAAGAAAMRAVMAPRIATLFFICSSSESESSPCGELSG